MLLFVHIYYCLAQMKMLGIINKNDGRYYIQYAVSYIHHSVVIIKCVNKIKLFYFTYIGDYLS